jgi:hypothetical protein
MVEGIAKPRRQFGPISVWIALVTFSVAMTATMIAVQTSKAFAGPVYDVVFPIFAVIVGVGAPVAHVVGVYFGVVAIARPGDRRGLGILGACLNTLAIAIGISLVYISLVALGSFR